MARGRYDEPHAARLAKRLLKHRAELTRFLWDKDLGGTNNAAERALRPAVVMRKFKRAVTDSDTGPDAVRYDRAAKPGVANLLEINTAVTGRTPQAVAEEYEQYGKLKVDTGEAVLAVLDPIRAR